MDSPEFMRERPAMDPLTQVIGLLRPNALLWKQLVASGAWSVRFPANDHVVFCLIGSGSCVCQLADGQRRVLHEGDFLLLAAPSVWSLGSGDDVVPVDLESAHVDLSRPATLLAGGDDEPLTEIFGGRFTFGDENVALLNGLLPPIVEVKGCQSEAARLRALLDLIGNEAWSDRPGKTLVLERLLEVLLIEVIRQSAAHRPEQHQGLLAGLGDPQTASVLRAMHADYQRNWNVAELASVACMSRSAFAERFNRVVGMPPIDYLLQWRMAMAKAALRTGRGRLAEVAGRCGYQSVSAFSAAFRRTVGHPPSYYFAERGTEHWRQPSH